jgi:acyl-CoA synthetase (AMP-forming)/AMP-acid ligase II
MWGVFDTVGPLLNAGNDDVVYARELHLILPALFAGASVAIPPRSGFSARRTLEDLNKHRITHFFGVAAEFRQLIDYLHSRNLSLPETLREIWVGAAPVHKAFLEKLKTVLPEHTRAWCVFGMTEILPVSRVSLTDKIAYRGEGDLVGDCFPGVHARLSAEYELMLRGPNLFSGYVGEPPCTELATGDLARLEEGRIVLLGRRKDMIIRRQFNIYPELYESTIDRIDGVERCAMVGYYDATLTDERVVLAVETSAGIDLSAFKNHLKRELTSGPFSIDAHAYPDEILLTTLPLAGRSRKIDKNRLRAHAESKFSCASP